MSALRIAKARMHCCTICGQWGEWTPEWAWYGSMRDYDERPERLVITCSAVCKYDAKTQGRCT